MDTGSGQRGGSRKRNSAASTTTTPATGNALLPTPTEPPDRHTTHVGVVTTASETASAHQQQQRPSLAAPPAAHIVPVDVGTSGLVASAASVGGDKSASYLSGKHPLGRQWVMWYDKPAAAQTESTWGENIKRLMLLSSVEDFCGMYNNMLAASRLPPGANYHMFKHGIEPKWEDPSNEGGGKWVLSVSNNPSSGSLCDNIWREVLFACIGELFTEETAAEICGVVVSTRAKYIRIALWTRNVDEKCIMKIGTEFRLVSCVPLGMKLSYQYHSPSSGQPQFSV
ncbi:eukaryotic translation initiation factor 4E [Pelomyxa schiedti]|nr:eukaryotic translation initiation factor 4E [Pelomyxa schiedti]